MGEGRTFTFDDADHYAAGFGDARVDLTITGRGNFKAQLTKVRVNHLELLGCCETLPRIAHISLPPNRVFLSFPLTAYSTINGFGWRKNDIALHGSAETTHQRSTRKLQWGLISIPSEQLASSGEALMGWPTPLPQATTILRPPRQDAMRFQHLFWGACRLAARGSSLVDDSEVTRSLEQEMLHAIVHCLTADEIEDRLETRRHHVAVMARFEDALTKRFDRKIALPEICAEIQVPERTLRMCCTEFTGVSPMRYALLQRLNRARAALRRADRSSTSVAEIARNHQFLELGRFAGIYRATFGESPSTTLQRSPLASRAGRATPTVRAESA
jgi:AraC-like DNA-binding protein